MPMSSCQKCGRDTYGKRRWCAECRAEETAPDYTGGDYECPHCGGRTSGEGVTCRDCRTVGKILGEDMDGRDPAEVSE